MDALPPHDMTNIMPTRTEKRILPVPGEDYWVLHLMAELTGVVNPIFGTAFTLGLSR